MATIESKVEEVISDDEKVETPESHETEKKFTQKELDAIVLKEKRKAQQKFDAIQLELKAYQDKDSVREADLQVKVDEAKKAYPEPVLKLLNKLTVDEQASWLQENPLETKPTLPNNPKEIKGGNKKPTKSLASW